MALLKDLKVQVCVQGSGRGRFVFHLANLLLLSAYAGVNMAYTTTMTSNIIVGRTNTAARALADKATTHLLWLDDDMLVPDDALLRLLEHNLPIVCANYVMRNASFNTIARQTITNDSLVTSVGKTGLEQVKYVGFGCILIRREVFEKIQFPWFGHRWFQKGKNQPIMYGKDIVDNPSLYEDWISFYEDAYFCDRCDKAGFPIYCDHDVSLNIGHSGEAVFTHEGLCL